MRVAGTPATGVSMMEVGQVLCVAGAPTPSPGPEGIVSVQVRCQGGKSLVDLGCTQTLEVTITIVHIRPLQSCL